MSIMNLIKMQIPTGYSVDYSCFSVGLATIGVCVFCALTSVGALFYFNLFYFLGGLF